MFLFRTYSEKLRPDAHRLRKLLPALLFLALIFPTSAAMGETQFVQRERVEVREGQGSFYPVLYVATLGETLEVILKDQGWFKVNSPKGPGWVFGQALGAQKPRSFRPFAGSARSSELDKTAGFKGFDTETEQAFVTKENLQAQMRQVDDLEKVPFPVSELRTFQLKGRVGPWGTKNK